MDAPISTYPRGSLGMLVEGAVLRAAIDPSLEADEATEIFRKAALGLVAVFTAQQGDDRSVDDLLNEALTPQDLEAG